MYPLVGHIDNGTVAGAIRKIFVYFLLNFALNLKLLLKKINKKAPLQLKKGK